MNIILFSLYMKKNYICHSSVKLEKLIETYISFLMVKLPLFGLYSLLWVALGFGKLISVFWLTKFAYFFFEEIDDIGSLQGIGFLMAGAENMTSDYIEGQQHIKLDTCR